MLSDFQVGVVGFLRGLVLGVGVVWFCLCVMSLGVVLLGGLFCRLLLILGFLMGWVVLWVVLFWRGGFEVVFDLCDSGCFERVFGVFSDF